MDPDTMTLTGKVISFGVQIGANPGAYRHFVVDPARYLLLYAVTDGSIASINLTTLQAAQFNISAAAFVGANPGAGRVITYEPSLRGLTVILDDGGENFGPGDRLKLSVGVANPDSSVTVDAYLVLIFPDGSRVFFERGEGGSLIPAAATADPTTWKKLLSRVTLTTGLDTGSVPILDYTFTGSEPTGTYQWMLAFMNAGTLDVLTYKSEPFLVGTYALSKFVGKWVGSWTNQTFGSTGSAVFEVADSSPGVVTITIDLGGNVFGGVDPPAFTVTAKLNSDGSITLGGGSSDFGTLKATAKVDGTLNGTIDSIPSTGIKSADFSGRLSDGLLNLNYTVNFTDTTKAVGILKATRQ